jgi:hypothetical protein
MTNEEAAVWNELTPQEMRYVTEEALAAVLRAQAAAIGRATEASGFVFPKLPHHVVQHEKVGPLWDRLSMQFYAAKCMRLAAPEGEADTQRLDFMLERGAMLERLGGKCRIGTAFGPLSDWGDDPRAAIDAARKGNGNV